eukprot:5340659-Prymnesium_polylepis.1
MSPEGGLIKRLDRLAVAVVQDGVKVPQPDSAVRRARKQPRALEGEAAHRARVAGELVEAAHHAVVPHLPYWGRAAV